LFELSNCKAGILLSATKTGWDLSWLKLKATIKVDTIISKRFFIITAG